MPLSTDERKINLAKDLLGGLDGVFGEHPGYRPAHAKGVILTGTFTPSPGAAAITAAPHANQASTPVIARFSDSTGIPNIPDNAPDASPRGLAIRFQLGEHAHTDIVSHSIDAFPTRTPEDFAALLHAIAASDPSKPHPNPVEVFVSQHPSALAFVQAPKPTPSSFARESYFAVCAFKFTSAEGKVTNARYQIHPAEGTDYPPADVIAARGPDFLFEELTQRLALGPIKLRIDLQIAAEGDVTDDATVRWPADRPTVPFGEVVLDAQAAAEDPEKKRIIFDPIPRIEGIESAGDPLLEARADVYLLSGRRRRAAAQS